MRRHSPLGVSAPRPGRRGETADEAIELVTALGPAGEILRLQGERAVHMHAQVDTALKEGLADMQTPEGVLARRLDVDRLGRQPGLSVHLFGPLAEGKDNWQRHGKQS